MGHGFSERSFFHSSPTIPNATMPFSQSMGPAGGIQLLQARAGAPHHLQKQRGPPLLSPCSPAIALSPPAFVPSRVPLPGPQHQPHIPGDMIHCHPMAGYHSPIIVHVSPSPDHTISPEMEPAALDLSSKRHLHGHSQSNASESDRVVGRSDGESSGGSTPGSSHSDGPNSGGNDLSGWDVDQVVRFVAGIPGCQEYAEVRIFLYFYRGGGAYGNHKSSITTTTINNAHQSVKTVSLCLCLYRCLYVSKDVSMSLYVSVSLCLPLHLSAVSLSLSPCLYLCVCVSLPHKCRPKDL